MFRTFIAGTDSTLPGYYKTESLITKLDTNLNVLWELSIPDPDSSRDYGHSPSKIIINNDGTAFIIGPDHAFHVSSYRESFVAKVRLSDGHLLWRKTFTHPRGFRGMYAADNGDGTLRFVRSTYQSTGQFHTLLSVGIIDTAGNILNEKEYGWKNSIIVSDDLIKLDDGNFYCSGEYQRNRGFGFKFSPNLDSLWMVNYDYPFNVGLSVPDAFIQDSSGMIAHTGWTVLTIDSVTDVYNWLFRVDTRGCTVSNCDISIYEHTQLDPRWRGFPIPSTGPLTIDHPELARFGSVAIQVFDLAGRKVYAQIHDCNQAISINIEAPGQYQVLIGDENLNALGLLKVVIQ
ncbi:T9SS type A sorting domain-containing protein [Phaeocystidibacter luteus]|uniref:T9SS type A sorting domain-containing protein n=1 Tax=Phaeocystidibacter luteus TaxID=911197 RepID=A0A6N6RJN9_9FLAO|nr:hypothetical protein [Phaeocystidibacter luteus]KAB2807692.1 hypothetical protein F8C67_11670 [Phaeocystidibacter luteus]